MRVTTDRSLSLSMRCYRRLLRAYPQSFLTEFEELLCQAFGDLAHRAVRTKGNWGLIVLWMRTLPDLVSSAFSQRFQTTAEWSFRLRWIAACTAGVVLATVFAFGVGFLLYQIQKSLGMLPPYPTRGVVLPRNAVPASQATFRMLRDAAVFGLILGFLQTFAIQLKRFRRVEWILATSLGTTIAAYGIRTIPIIRSYLNATIHPWRLFVDQHPGLYYGGSVLLCAAVVGILQAFVLTRQSSRALVWIPASAIGCFACEILVNSTQSPISILSLGAVYGLLTVIPMEWILQLEHRAEFGRIPLPKGEGDAHRQMGGG